MPKVAGEKAESVEGDGDGLTFNVKRSTRNFQGGVRLRNASARQAAGRSPISFRRGRKRLVVQAHVLWIGSTKTGGRPFDRLRVTTGVKYGAVQWRASVAR